MGKKIIVGAHISIARGFWQAIIRADQIGATCLQIFTKSNRQWAAKKITNEDVEKFLKIQKNLKIDLVIAHASYLINLASEKKDVQKKSIKALADEIARCQMLGIKYLVLHPGSNSSENKSEICRQVAQNINEVFKLCEPHQTMVLLETMAGQGSTIGKSFENLGQIISLVDRKKNIGVCVDTCHIFAAGYKFDDKASYKKLWQEFDKVIGLEKIKVIHINDSKKDFGSCVDRHENIGKGKIKSEAFKMLMNDKKFENIAKIIETPKSTEDLKSDQQNLDTLKSYVKK
jgi:deoxyribonuclease-4